MKQILNGMKALHEQNVIHRDLKLANILIHNGQLKIADLGFAKQLDHKDQKDNISLGSLGTMAPEVVEYKPYGMLADMFSIGCIYYQMIQGQLPFSTKSHKDFLRDIQSNVVTFDDGIAISEESKQLIRRMVEYDPNKRLKWVELYDHPLIRNSRDISQIDLNSRDISQIDLNQQNANSRCMKFLQIIWQIILWILKRIGDITDYLDPDPLIIDPHKRRLEQQRIVIANFKSYFITPEANHVVSSQQEQEISFGQIAASSIDIEALRSFYGNSDPDLSVDIDQYFKKHEQQSDPQIQRFKRNIFIDDDEASYQEFLRAKKWIMEQMEEQKNSVYIDMEPFEGLYSHLDAQPNDTWEDYLRKNKLIQQEDRNLKRYFGLDVDKEESNLEKMLKIHDQQKQQQQKDRYLYKKEDEEVKQRKFYHQDPEDNNNKSRMKSRKFRDTRANTGQKSYRQTSNRNYQTYEWIEKKSDDKNDEFFQ